MIVAGFTVVYCFVFVVEKKLTTHTVCAGVVCAATPGTSHHITSYHIVSHRILSYRILSYRILSYRIVYNRIVSCHISYQIRSDQTIYHVIYHIIYHIASYIISYLISNTNAYTDHLGPVGNASAIFTIPKTTCNQIFKDSRLEKTLHVLFMTKVNHFACIGFHEHFYQTSWERLNKKNRQMHPLISQPIYPVQSISSQPVVEKMIKS